MRFNGKTGEWTDPRERFLCEFGVTEAIGAFLATDVGLGATAGAIGADALVGAGGGALLGGITGGDPGLGALTGALGGAGFGAGGAFASDLGLSTGAGEALGGALGGAAAGAATGGNIGLDAALGAIPGLGNVALGGGGFTAAGGTPAASTIAPGPSAASAAPLPVAGAGNPDLAFGGDSILGNYNLTAPGSGFGVAGGGLPADTAQFSAITPGPGTIDQTVSAAGGGAPNAYGIPGGTAGDANAIQTGLNAAGNAPNVGGGDFSSLPSVDPNNVAGQEAADASSFKRFATSTWGTPDAASGGGGNSIMNLIKNPTWNNAGTALSNNAGSLLSGGLLLKNLLAPQTIPGLSNLSQEANLLQGQGTQLGSYLQTGLLPPGAQAGLTNATNAAEAAIRSKYAQLGESGSTAEATDLANAKLQAQADAFQLQSNLLNSGIQATGLSSGIFENLARLNIEQNAATGSAISNFAAALAGGGGRGLTLNIPGLS